MLFKTHVVFSVFVWIVLSYFVEMPWWVLIFVLAATMFVDIDAWNSKVGNRWYLRPLQIFVKHRGVLHSLFFGLLISLIIGSFSIWGGFGFFVGYVSHLFLDCLTKSGIILFWPLRYRIKGFVKSGGIIEEVIFVLLMLVDIGLIILYYINAY